MRLERSTGGIKVSHGARKELIALRTPARLVCVRPGLSGFHSRSCEIRGLSTREASISLLTTLGLPLHYYIEIDGFGRRLGCAEWYRRPGEVGVRFLSPLYPWEIAWINGSWLRKRNSV